jgi:hypothetical protein
MTQQLTLFDVPPNIVRKSDPATSQQAAKEIEPKLSSAQAAMRMMIDRSTVPHTAQELAFECSRLFGGMAETYRKRAHELVLLNLATECEARACEVTGKMATTFRRVTT